MSRRARITLNPAPEPDVETEPNQAREAEPLPKTEARTGNDFAAAANEPARPSAPAKGALNVGAIIKIVFAGLAAASLVLLWRNRRF